MGTHLKDTVRGREHSSYGHLESLAWAQTLNLSLSSGVTLDQGHLDLSTTGLPGAIILCCRGLSRVPSGVCQQSCSSPQDVTTANASKH